MKSKITISSNDYNRIVKVLASHRKLLDALETRFALKPSDDKSRAVEDVLRAFGEAKAAWGEMEK